jgi:hypothetical protein
MTNLEIVAFWDNLFFLSMFFALRGLNGSFFLYIAGVRQLVQLKFVKRFPAPLLNCTISPDSPGCSPYHPVFSVKTISEEVSDSAE